MGRIFLLATLLICSILSCSAPKKVEQITEKKMISSPIKYDSVESLLAQMTLDEKIGQMNQYSGFWNATGPTPKDGDAAIKYKNLKSGLVGSMLNVRGVEQIRELQLGNTNKRIVIQ